jgi:hypothetical protein
MSSTRIEQLIDDVQAAFDRPPAEIEPGLDVDDAALLQLRKACRLLAGAASLREAGYYTLVIELLKNAKRFWHHGNLRFP